MVRRQGKRSVQNVLESGNDEKKKGGKNSSSHADVSGAREPKQRRREEQRDNSQELGSFSSHLSFKSDCFELSM
jgi:hypothetical protein